MDDFLKTLAHNLSTQDNRITQDPVFVVQQKRTIYGIDPDYTENIVWINVANDSELATPEEVELLESEAMDDDGWTKTGFYEWWEFVTCCFTEAGAEDYINANGHNLNNPRIYVESAYRNLEWIKLREYLKGGGNVPD